MVTDMQSRLPGRSSVLYARTMVDPFPPNRNDTTPRRTPWRKWLSSMVVRAFRTRLVPEPTPTIASTTVRAFRTGPVSGPSTVARTTVPRAPVVNRYVHLELVHIHVLLWSVPAVELVTTVSSARIPSVAQRFALPVVTIMVLTVSRISSSLRHETNRSFPLAAAGKTSPLFGFSLTSHKHSLQRSSKNRSNLAPSSVSTVPTLHAAASWAPS